MIPSPLSQHNSFQDHDANVKVEDKKKMYLHLLRERGDSKKDILVEHLVVDVPLPSSTPVSKITKLKAKSQAGKTNEHNHRAKRR